MHTGVPEIAAVSNDLEKLFLLEDRHTDTW